MEREAQLLPVLARTLPLAVPRIEFLGRQAGSGLKFVGCRRIESVSLTRDLFLSLDAATRLRCTGDLAAFLRQLHASPAEPVRQAGVARLDYGTDAAHALEEARRRIFPRIDPRTRGHCRRVLERFQHEPEIFEFQPALLHGDLSPEHLLFDPALGTVAGVIDFGDMALGDPGYDLRFLYEDCGVEFLDLFLRQGPVHDRTALLAKVHFYHEWDSILWALDVLAKGDLGESQAALGELQRQSLQSAAPPWLAIA